MDKFDKELLLEYKLENSLNSTQQTIVDVFEQQVINFNDKTAVKSSSRELTYMQLNSLANKFGRVIISNLNTIDNPSLESQFTVALLYEHEADMIVGMLSTLKTGSIYVPLDPTYPEKRLIYMLRDSQASIIITNSKNINLAQKLINEAQLNIYIVNTDDEYEELDNSNLAINIQSDMIAYVLYTSGSTGNPKGVIQSHDNVVFHIKSFSKALGLNSMDKLALFTSYSHTVGILDTFGMLLNGGAVYPYDIKKDGSLKELYQWLNSEEITIYHSVPTLFRHFIKILSSEDVLSKMRFLLLGGEAVYKRDFDLYKIHFGDECKFVNIFGSTEVIVATLDILDKNAEVANTSVPVGLPIDEVSILLINENKEVPALEIGELVYESKYLAKGYKNLENKTKEVFVENPVTGEGIVYRSGDLGRILENGKLEYLGRKDSQIKIRGYRVEPGEIETKILEHKMIKEAVVIAKEDGNGDKYLCSFIVCDDDLDIQELADNLIKELPSYLVPAYFIQLDEMPLTANGKVHIQALMDIDDCSDEQTEYEAPRNDIEQHLSTIWCNVLGVEQVGINDDFFVLGGNSINSLRIVAKAHEHGINISVGDILNNKTIANITEMVDFDKEIEDLDEETILF